MSDPVPEAAAASWKAPERYPALAIHACPICGDPLVEMNKEGDCRTCGAYARLRTLVPLLKSVLGPLTTAAGNLPLLSFALTTAEQKVLAPYYSRFKSVSLYGDYARGHESGVDARDLSRYPRNAFSGHFSLLLFDYFEEQEKALAEAFRVLAPGGLLITHIASYRLTDDESPPQIRQRIYPRKNYFDYLPSGVSLPSATVGIHWFVKAMDRVGFHARWIQIDDPAGTVNWFIGVKAGGDPVIEPPPPPASRAERPALRAVPRAEPTTSPGLRQSLRRFVVDNCPICGEPARNFTSDKCPSCSALSRARSLAPIAAEIVGPHLAASGEVRSLPLLAFAMDDVEKRLLDPIFRSYRSVSLYGKYVDDSHIEGVDARDLSRFSPGEFSGLFSIALFDYFSEQEKALAEAFRVIAPGGTLFTYIMPERLVDGDAPPFLDEMMGPGYFSYAPPDVDLPSIKVGRAWFVQAMRRAGFVAEEAVVRDSITGEDHSWFVGFKPPASGRPARLTTVAKDRPAVQPEKPAAGIDPGQMLFSGSVIPPVALRGPTGFHTILSALALDRTTRALCIGGGSWLPNGAVLALLDHKYPTTIVEWRKDSFIAALQEKVGQSASIITAPIDTLSFASGFGIVAVDLYASDFMETITKDLPLLERLLAPAGVVICRFAYQLDAGVDERTRKRLEAQYVARFGSLRPSTAEVAASFRDTPFRVRGLVDRLNGASLSTGEGWLILERRETAPPASPPPGGDGNRVNEDARAGEPPRDHARLPEAWALHVPDANPAPNARNDALPAPAVHSAPAIESTQHSRTFSTPLDPALGYRRVAMTVQVPSLPPEAAGTRFSSHSHRTDEGRSTRTVFGVRDGGIVVTEDLGRHWDFVPLPEAANLPLQNVFQASGGNILVQAAGPHRPTDPRGHPNLEAPIFVCDRDFRVIDRLQPGKTHWHGPRAIDESQGVILYAEYPENAIKYAPEFAADPARYRHLVEDAGVFRSTDGGRSWSRVFQKSWQEIRHFHTAIADPFEPNTWYVSSGDQPHECRVWRSRDAGLTWEEITSDPSGVPLHPSLKGKHGSIHRHTDMVVLKDHLLWGSDDLLGPPKLYRDPEVKFGNRIGSRMFVSPKTGRLNPKVVGFVGSHVRSIVDVGPAYVLMTEAKSLAVTGRPQVCLLFKSEPYQLIELFTVDRYHGSGTGFTFSRHSRAAVDGRFFTYRDSNDMFPGGSRILQWDISFE